MGGKGLYGESSRAVKKTSKSEKQCATRIKYEEASSITAERARERFYSYDFERK